MYRTDFLDSVGEGEGGMIWENGIETCILSGKKRITSLCSIQDAWGWCTGMTLRDGMGREVGEGFRMGGTHVHPWLTHVNVWPKPLHTVK